MKRDEEEEEEEAEEKALESQRVTQIAAYGNRKQKR